ncbi:CLUMA_CG012957, isoform A [Clunio marinus]|uniref:CLUMA_CG012957, isoform A n=1 Tax=Clunio marinus TaxID=568069 RepID=A0A1J1IKN8_9DIPT|nr:CLUMA_CG012957, isoform A [Clunio marinus]
MGLKGFYSFSTRHINDCHKMTNMKEEIEKYINYHFEVKTEDMLCGYQLNKIKFDFDAFLKQLQDAGAHLEFVFKKVVADDKEFLSRRLMDYKQGCDIVKAVEEVGSFELLEKLFRNRNKTPFNTMILIAIIQSAKKFGNVHGFNNIYGKPAVQQIELAKKLDASWIIGLDTFYFLMPGKWKIWNDMKLNMKDLLVQEIDPNVILTQLDLDPKHGPLFACLLGEFQSTSNYQKKVQEHFGLKHKFENAANFIKSLEIEASTDLIKRVIDNIFKGKANERIHQDFERSLATFEINFDVGKRVDEEILQLVKNDFVSIAEEIFLNQPIFISPTFFDMRKEDMKTINDLVVPLITRTASVLLRKIDDKEERTIIILESHDGNFKTIPIVPVVPPFPVPSLETLLKGEIHAIDKTQILFWVTDLNIEEFAFVIIPQDYAADCVILLYLMKHQCINTLDARCILKTIIDTRRHVIPLEGYTEYPETICERAFRCCFLYSKMYFYVQSCLTSLGMKNMCFDIEFDGAYFQKIYALNILAKEDAEKENQMSNTKQEDSKDESDEVTVENVEESQMEADPFNPIKIIDEFISLIRASV